MEGPCEFCGQKAPRVGGAEDGLSSDLFLCGQCKAVLRDPGLGLAFVRGNASLALRGVVKPSRARQMVDALLGGLASLRPRRSS